MKSIKYLIIAFCLIFLSNIAPAQDFSIPGQKFSQKCFEKDSGILRSELKGHFEKTAQGKYLLTEQGQGDYGNFKNITWQIKAEMQLHQSLLCPIYTICNIKNTDNDDTFTCLKEYDYANKKIFVRQIGTNGRLIKKVEFILREKTTDFATLVFFLKPLVMRRDKKEVKRFYLLSSEPDIYKVKARYEGEEKITINGEQFESVRIKLDPDMGILNFFAKSLVPPTFIWYQKEYPYAWLKYQGLEAGKNSSKVIIEASPL